MLASLGAGLVLAAGCQTEPSKPRAKSGSATKADSCAENMHDLCGYLLQYYVVHHALPERLAELQSLVDLDRQLPLACPKSGKAYLYFRDGLIAEGEQNRLLVVDPELSADGNRWAIVTLPPEGKTPLGLWVVQLNQIAFQQFHVRADAFTP